MINDNSTYFKYSITYLLISIVIGMDFRVYLSAEDVYAYEYYYD
jgi:hypothetical protein